MKPLFFRALAPQEVAPALMNQARLALKPFSQYLRQAIHVAKQRQFRYKLRWERVRSQHTLRLDSQDAILLISRPPPQWRITNWPEGKEPDLSQLLMVVNRGVTLRVEAVRQRERTLFIQPDGLLRPDDTVWWCGHACSFEAVKVEPPKELIDSRGGSFKVLHCAEHDARNWKVRVEGVPSNGALRVETLDVEVQRLSALDGVRRLFDARNRELELSGGQLKVEELPAEGPLISDTGIRFRWTQQKEGRNGLWLQLLLPETLTDEDFIDPRAAFCGDDVTEVWTQPRHDPKTVVKVKRVDRERYQLLVERLPPADSELYLPLDIRNLLLQRRALRQLTDAPLPHHRGLLRLCEHPDHVRWPIFGQKVPEHWFSLTDLERSGTREQRTFVSRALASPDFALLEGPPGSGKTTAICELVQQCIARGERVLLCASTHVAIDNVLERLLKEDAPVVVDAIRIGNFERVDPKVQACQLDTRVDALVEQWRGLPSFQEFGDGELREMAVRTLVMGAHLTCGTTMGIVRHPLFQDRDSNVQAWERPIATQPHWDVLIVDEASKTTVQEFLVPALMARRHVIVGDVRQLPPFTERADIVANLGSLLDGEDREVFPKDHQRARLLLWRLGRKQLQQPGVRLLLVEPPAVLQWLEREFVASGRQDLSVVRVVARTSRSQSPIQELTVREVQSGAARALLLATADWVLVGNDLLESVAACLPATLLRVEELTQGEWALPVSHPFLFRAEAWRAPCPVLEQPFRERNEEVRTFIEVEGHERAWLTRHDWAGEMAWRLTRLHELKRSRNVHEREFLERGIGQLLPRAADVRAYVEEIQDIGLPSILEVIQEGIGKERAQRASALTEGLPAKQRPAFLARFESLSWQHRMHPDISAFPRDVVYKGDALKDANTLQARDAELHWDFGPELKSRSVWLHTRGHEVSSVNQAEVDEMMALLKLFVRWAEDKGPPRRKSGPPHWEVACLSFYVKQERAIQDALRKLTGDSDRQTRFYLPNIEVVCATVDRFQGREADLVLLSMRNTRRIGFLDSPNRLNVAVTRARQQLVVIGNADYFSDCGVHELTELARRIPRIRARPGDNRRAR